MNAHFVIQTSRRTCYIAKQPKSARTPKSCLYNSRHCYRRWNMLSIHCSSGFDEWVPGTRIKCSKWRSQIVVFLVRIHRWNGKRLYLCCYATFGGRINGQVNLIICELFACTHAYLFLYSTIIKDYFIVFDGNRFLCNLRHRFYFILHRDLVHRQTACSAIKHMSLGVFGFGCEDALAHLLNYVWPNIFETSPHVINAVTDAIEGMRVALGAPKVLQYALQVTLRNCLCISSNRW